MKAAKIEFSSHVVEIEVHRNTIGGVHNAITEGLNEVVSVLKGELLGIRVQFSSDC